MLNVLRYAVHALLKVTALPVPKDSTIARTNLSALQTACLKIMRIIPLGVVSAVHRIVQTASVQ